MKKIEAKIIADSINPQGDRITTYILTFPRFILAELNTHRVFSKNSASSRAIPFEKMVKMVQEDPFIPIAWQKDHKGMQGTEYFSKEELFEFQDFIVVLEKMFAENKGIKDILLPLLSDLVGVRKTLDNWWLFARDKAIQTSCLLHLFGVTKQLCNRLLEPFMWHTVLLTGTEFKNFFELRCPIYRTFGNVFKSRKDCIEKYPANINLTDLDWLEATESQAEIHMQALAEAMWDAMNESTPKELKAGEWHIPFGDNVEYYVGSEGYDILCDKRITGNELSIKISTARCARLSYMTFDGKIDYEKDIKLHDSLLESHHMSPFEHCARAMSENEYTASKLTGYSRKDKDNYGWCRNFKGFIQYRHLLENKI